MSAALNREDLIYFADVLVEVFRYDEAVEYIYKLAKMNPNLSKEERTKFGQVLKFSIDSDRETLRKLRDQQDKMENTHHQELLNITGNLITKHFTHLTMLCDKTIKLINETILPASETIQGEVFFLKLRGDLYRYISEFAQDEFKETSRKNADDSYSLAMEKSNGLKITDPLRLGLLLNVAVFKYEHKFQYSEASQLLQTTIEAVNDDLSDLSTNSAEESQSTLNSMKSNLYIWAQAEIEEEEDVEEEAQQEE